MEKYNFSDKHKLPEHLIAKVLCMDEFANGAAQANLELNTGEIYREVLIANSTHVAAIRGLDVIPFSIDEIKDVFQRKDDKNPTIRNGWKYF